MYRPRIIPVLLLQDNSLVKTTGFTSPHYLGDPINAVHLYNEMKADELIFLDISATSQHRTISLEFVRTVGEEANMPFGVGGGIRSLEDIRSILSVGAERVVLGSVALERPEFVREASQAFGSSTICVCLDIFLNFWKKYVLYYGNGKKKHRMHPVAFATLMEEMGAGEIIVQSINRDGTRTGYDVHITHEINKAVSIPVTALGGAGSIQHMKELYDTTQLSGIAAGSLFVYQGSRKGVLINYPDRSILRGLWNK
jgi:cyclase